MSAPPDGGAELELLERALGYTRVALQQVAPADLPRRTPCRDWTLDRLLHHLDDALDAFAEGARGDVGRRPVVPLDVRVATLQAKACALLGAWSGPAAPAVVRVGDVAVPASLVPRVAALEIAVHGWDVVRATGQDAPLPDDLARALRPVAAAVVADDDRGTRFAEPLVVPPTAGEAERLLAALGRRTGLDLSRCDGQVSGIRRTEHRPAS